MKFQNIIGQLLTEVNKKDILVNKLKFKPYVADELVKLCGPLSVWMGNKLIKKYFPEFGTPENDWTIEQIGNSMNNPIRYSKEHITSIMDWIRIELDGNINQYKDLNFDDLYEISRAWHINLGVGEGDIDYVEKNDIILDFRTDNGIGFYWCDLNTNNSNEECERMGHCGRTGYNNTIYSLRENKKINEKHTKNVSHLTAAVGESDKTLYQLKGQKNSKPKPEYHQYIIPFILSDYIQKWGSEYNSANDFKLSDLSKEDLIMIYKQKPTLFYRYGDKKALAQLGVIDQPKMEFTLSARTDQVDRYVGGDWKVRTHTDKETGRQTDIGFFETFLNGDTWDLYEGNSYDGDWEGAINYHIDKINTARMWDIVKKLAIKEEYDLDSNTSLSDAIDQVDDNDDIKNALRNCLRYCESDDYYNHVNKKLKKCLEFYGDVIKMDDTGIEIKVDLGNIISEKNVDDNELYEAMERCNDDLDCTLTELLSDYIDKPKFDIDYRWYPNINNKDFNVFLTKKLDELQ